MFSAGKNMRDMVIFEIGFERQNSTYVKDAEN
jgi:hypothetical protein